VRLTRCISAAARSRQAAQQVGSRSSALRPPG
jgi:hypothetical protein